MLRVEPKKERALRRGPEHGQAPQRPQQVAGAQRAEQVGGVIEREGPIHISNVMLLDPKDGKPTRVGIEREDGKRYRVAERTGARLD